MKCDHCQLLRINGLVCHEIGCPVAWKDYLRLCFECGAPFVPDQRRQRLCQDCERDLAEGFGGNTHGAS